MSRSRCLLLVLWLSSCLGIVSSASAQGRFGPASDAVDEPGVRRAFVVGIDSYSDPAFPDLRFARRDAEELTRVLLQPELVRQQAAPARRHAKPRARAQQDRRDGALPERVAAVDELVRPASLCASQLRC